MKKLQTMDDEDSTTKEIAVFKSLVAPGCALAICLCLAPAAHAIPAFARQYGTSCATCHVDFPKLNDFGKAFKDAGFKFPKDDGSFLKVQPVKLGADAQKEGWPHTIWPGSIPGFPPIGLRYNQFFQVTSSNANNFNAQLPAGTVGSYIPTTDFETGFFSIFTAGNFGSDIAFWVDDDISVSGENSNGELGDAYLKFVNLGRFLKLTTDSFSLRVGQFELDLPFTQARTYDISPYDIYTQANIGTATTKLGQQFVNNNFTLQDVARGVEISGGHHYGGYHYSLAIFDQNTSGTSATAPNVPSATGGANGGVGFNSDSNFKDIFARLAYRQNLERDASRHQIQAAGKNGPRTHNYISLGSSYFYGRSVQQISGFLPNGSTPTVLTAREPFYRVGPDFEVNLHDKLDLYGLYLYGHDANLLPFVSAGAAGPTGFTSGHAATFSGGFSQADYMIYPWMMAIMRWDRVNSTSDLLNGYLAGTMGAPATSFYSPLSSVRNRYTPGMQFLIRPNIKASFEYQVRPQQVVYNLTSVPANGIPTPIGSPFRTNTFVVGLEFAY
jgi:hypothetical protein